MTPPSNKQTRKAAETTARERAAALKAQAAREERRHKVMVRGGIGLVIAAIVGTVVAIPMLNSSGTPTGILKPVVAAGATSLPPWPAPTDVATAVAKAGLVLLPNETLNRHDHAHLDVWTDGKTVPVPAYIGIQGGANSTGLSSLHTHDATGVIHIESPAGDRFTLGQVFNEWNVLFTPTQIGGLKTGAGKTLTVYVNGKALTTDPTKLELLKHQEIAIVYGTAAENAKVKVPSSYKWTNGL
ncbi:MAG: hypothetical protein QOJ11_3470 [Frankiales bacterium]|nr:hypothetical protein [Frankiales bacterium]